MHKRLKKIAYFLVVNIALTITVALPASAGNSTSYVPCDSYIYDYNGEPVIIPHAYIPGCVFNGNALGTGDLFAPSDVQTDSTGNVYIADSGNNRLICLDSDFHIRFILSEFQTPAGSDSLKYPTGLCIAPNGDIYIADTKNSRIVEFNSKGEFIRVIGEPKTTLLDKGYIYAPSKVSVDKSGNIYVVATGVNMGVLHFSQEGDFVGFIGAQRS
mgnify:FL=1